MMRRIAATIAVATVVTTAAMAGGAPAFAAAHRASSTPTATDCLSLGDSLAQGVQPNSSGTSVETNQGYPNQLFAALRTANPTLKLVKLGCPGETTGTMINGGICTYTKGSQLAQAAAFLASHRGKVQLVTIDIGANDRSEEHTSELQSHSDIVCRLLLEKKNINSLPLRVREWLSRNSGELIQAQPGNSGLRPHEHFRIAVLTDDVRVNMVRIHAEVRSEA